MATAPKRVAQPRPKAPEPPKVPGRVFSTKDQDEFIERASVLAERLGWQGDADNELNEIRVADAKGYLVRVLHEVHQAALTPERDAPTAEAVCEHLGITDADEAKLVADTLAALHESERAAAPQNPTSIGETRVAQMSAGLAANLSTAVSAVMGSK